MEEQEYKDELSKEEKQEQLLIASAKRETQNLSKLGFMMALVSYAFYTFVSFINSCLFRAGIKGYQLYKEFQPLEQPLYYITGIVCIAGMIISIFGYKRSTEDDATSKKFAAVGITLGSIRAFGFVCAIIYAIIQAIFKVH